MRIVELDSEVARKAVEGYQNELAPEAAKLEALYRQVACPRCDAPGGRKEFDVRPDGHRAGHAFGDPNTLVARALLRCARCNCLYNPHVLDGQGRPMIVQRGDPGIHV